MNLPTTDQLAHCTHAELLALVTVLCDEVRRLQAEVVRLTQPPPTSRNSSVPPSRDQKAKLPPPAEHKKHGPPVGHERHTRPLLETPTQVIVAAVAQCQACHADLQAVTPQKVQRRQVTELPVVVPVVIETQQHARRLARTASASIAASCRRAWKRRASLGRSWKPRWSTSNTPSI